MDKRLAKYIARRLNVKGLVALIIKLFIAVAITILALFFCLHFGLIQQNASTGVINDSLALCPRSPNCVSTSCNKKDIDHYVEPIKYSAELNPSDIKKLILSMPRSSLVHAKENINYMHFQFKTFLGFIDDVEILVNTNNKEIYFRSASRLGYFDFGVNRKRYNKIKNKISRSMK